MLNERGCRGDGRAGEEGREKGEKGREKGEKGEKEGRKGEGEWRKEDGEGDRYPPPCTLPLKQRGLDTIQIEPSLFFT